MGTDDGDLDLLEVEPATARRRGRAPAVFWAVVAVVVVGIAAGAVAVVAHRFAAGSSSASRGTAVASTSASSRSAAPVTRGAEEQGPVVLEAGLQRAGRPVGTLTVGTAPLVTGSAPAQVANFGTCTPDATALEYLPVQIRRPPGGLAARVTVQRGPSTPADAGRIGFFFQASTGDALPCQGSAWPTSDSFESVNDPSVITGYVVLDRAVTAATPQGRPDVFPTLRLRITDVRQFDAHGPEPLTLAAPQVGSLCPGTTAAACVELG